MQGIWPGNSCGAAALIGEGVRGLTGISAGSWQDTCCGTVALIGETALQGLTWVTQGNWRCSEIATLIGEACRWGLIWEADPCRAEALTGEAARHGAQALIGELD